MFRYEEAWLREASCHDIIHEAWEREGDCRSKLMLTATSLGKWSKEKFGDFAKEIRECKKVMNELMEKEQTEDVFAKMRAIDLRMDELEEREELYWRQRS